MCKPMIVSLPFLLLAIDFWPLNRRFSRRLLIEKLPFAALAAGVAWLTVLAQGEAGTLGALEPIPPLLRLENSLFTIFVYIGKTIWPVDLVIPYSWPIGMPLWKPLLAGAGVAGISGALIRWRKERPWLTAGWFWFLITLLPVIGIVQAGPQSRADRYMYVPMTGLLIMAAWELLHLVKRWPGWTGAATGVATAICITFAVMTWQQSHYWSDTETLFRHATEVEPANDIAWEYLGGTLRGKPGALPEEMECYRTAIHIRPGFVEAHDSLGRALRQAGRIPEAVAEYAEALRILPTYTVARCDSGLVADENKEHPRGFESVQPCDRESAGLPVAPKTIWVSLFGWQTETPAVRSGILNGQLNFAPLIRLGTLTWGLFCLRSRGSFLSRSGTSIRHWRWNPLTLRRTWVLPQL